MELKESSSLVELRRQMLEVWIAGVAEIFIVESLRRGSYIGEGQKSAQRFPAGLRCRVGWYKCREDSMKPRRDILLQA